MAHSKFDNYMSDPIPLKNGTTQGDPASMLYYSFYNAPLIEIAKFANELSPGFVDDTMMLAIGPHSTSLILQILGVIFNSKLRWSLQQTKALTTASFWSA